VYEIVEGLGNVDERAVIDSSDETGQRKGKAAGLRNSSGPSSKSGSAKTEEIVEKGPGMIKL